MNNQNPALTKKIASHRRRYKDALRNMNTLIKGELEHMEHELEPSSSVDTAAFQVIQRFNSLKSLLELQED